jgi:hypothetical protein
MRTIATVVCALLASASSLVAQIDRADFEQAMQKAGSRCRVTQCILNAQVFNAPFSAEATTAWQPPASKGQASLRATARYYRDNAGRVRVEQTFAGRDDRPQRIILAPAGDSRDAYVLDPVARTVSTPVGRGLVQLMLGDGGFDHFVLPTSMRQFVSFFVVPDFVESASDESLGESSMAGVRVTGTRFITRLPGFLGTGRAERWVSTELGLVVYSRSEDAHFGILEYQLTNISRSDPKAQLFEVPEDYRETPFEFPLTWHGPYTPKPGSK